MSPNLLWGIYLVFLTFVDHKGRERMMENK